MRVLRQILFALLGMAACASLCAPGAAQELFETPAADVATNWAGDAANLDGCQVIARIDNQIVLACEVLWRVNLELEAIQERMPADQRITPEQVAEARQHLLRREVARLLDRKLLFEEFRRTLPPDGMARIDENLREPFNEHELPELMKQLKVDNQRDLERELARLGSSLADVRRTFNERVIAREWIGSKVKINEEVTPEEMLEYYQAHLADYEYPTQARWEELMVRRSRFRDPAEAYAELCNIGNEVFLRGMEQGIRGPAFAEVAKARSDGFTAKDGGVHDWTTKGALKSAAIDEALFSLEVGQMSPILVSEDGFHIVRVLERKDAGRRPFTDVQAEIRERLKERRFHEGVEQYLAKIRREARIWTAFTGPISADALLGRRPDETQRR